MKIAVAGGGLAGLCSALDLSKEGHEVHIFEKYPSFGGLASAFEIAGTHLERFYHHIFTSDLDILDLIEELGLWQKLRWHAENNGNFYGGKISPISPAWKLLLFDGLSFFSRFRLALWSKYLSLLKDHQPFENITARDWITSHMGWQVWEVMWEPLFRSKFGAYAGQVSMTWFFGRIKARFGPSRRGVPQGCLGYLDGSTQVMVDALLARLKAQGVQLHASTPVRRILAEGGRATGVETKNGAENFDAVLVTCSTPEFLESASDILPPGLRDNLASFRYYGSVVAVLELEKSLSPVYWTNILDTSIPFLAVIEQTRMIPASTYQGRHIVYLAKYLDTADPFFSKGNNEVLAEFYGHLKRVFPDFDASKVAKAHVMRADYTQPIVLPGHGSRIPPHRLPLKGLYLANMTQIYPEDRGMSYSIGMGRRVAAMIHEDSKGGPGETEKA